MEFSSPKIKKFILFREIERSGPKIKKVLIQYFLKKNFFKKTFRAQKLEKDPL